MERDRIHGRPTERTLEGIYREQNDKDDGDFTSTRWNASSGSWQKPGAVSLAHQTRSHSLRDASGSS